MPTYHNVSNVQERELTGKGRSYLYKRATLLFRVSSRYFALPHRSVWMVNEWEVVNECCVFKTGVARESINGPLSSLTG